MWAKGCPKRVAKTTVFDKKYSSMNKEVHEVHYLVLKVEQMQQRCTILVIHVNYGTHSLQIHERIVCHFLWFMFFTGLLLWKSMIQKHICIYFWKAFEKYTNYGNHSCKQNVETKHTVWIFCIYMWCMWFMNMKYEYDLWNSYICL